ncbi:hypothetical protein C8F04DRAFT_1069939 [Mycena alexandri]|uniref:Uncharacterized protein n=1 Tax=Mycena alexandri TaxID=1745969 RepID=A0AAD6TFT6_9AGAR|nr:hypothetical protein C8F04DRAFT_1069939 [Mycena alexandri]
MPPSSTQLKIAHDIGQAVFEWERLTEEHSAVLRQHPNELAVAYEELERVAPSNVLPPRDDWDRCIEDLARALEPKAVDIMGRLKAVSVLYFLCRLSMMKAGEDPVVLLEMMRFKTSLHNNFTYEKVEMRLPARADMHPYLAKQLGIAPVETPSTPSSLDPLVMPADPFTAASVRHHIRTPVTAEEITRFRRNPDPLLAGIFISAETEAFQVASMVVVARGDGWDRLFYLAFADEGPEAVCYSSEDLFNLLQTSASLTS